MIVAIRAARCVLFVVALVARPLTTNDAAVAVCHAHASRMCDYVTEITHEQATALHTNLANVVPRAAPRPSSFLLAPQHLAPSGRDQRDLASAVQARCLAHERIVVKPDGNRVPRRPHLDAVGRQYCRGT